MDWLEATPITIILGTVLCFVFGYIVAKLSQNSDEEKELF